MYELTVYNQYCVYINWITNIIIMRFAYRHVSNTNTGDSFFSFYGTFPRICLFHIRLIMIWKKTSQNKVIQLKTPRGSYVICTDDRTVRRRRRARTKTVDKKTWKKNPIKRIELKTDCVASACSAVTASRVVDTRAEIAATQNGGEVQCLSVRMKKTRASTYTRDGTSLLLSLSSVHSSFRIRARPLRPRIPRSSQPLRRRRIRGETRHPSPTPPYTLNRENVYGYLHTYIYIYILWTARQRAIYYYRVHAGSRRSASPRPRLIGLVSRTRRPTVRHCIVIVVAAVAVVIVSGRDGSRFRWSRSVPPAWPSPSVIGKCFAAGRKISRCLHGGAASSRRCWNALSRRCRLSVVCTYTLTGVVKHLSFKTRVESENTRNRTMQSFRLKSV